MSVSGISSSSLSTYSTTSGQGNFQQVQKAFQQLGQDLQSGNLSAAQSDFSTLQNLVPKLSAATSSAATSTVQSNNPLLQNFDQLSKDLQSGNLSAAQQDYTNIQQAFQRFSPKSGGPEGRHHHDGGGDLGNGLRTAGSTTDSSSSTGSTLSVNV
jgi:outer membrane protein assembly factor BamD (BamD/ComL family)